MDDEPCGYEWTIDPENIMQFGSDVPVAKTERVTLVCSLPVDHTPRNRHSDGMTDWLGDDE